MSSSSIPTVGVAATHTPARPTLAAALTGQITHNAALRNGSEVARALWASILLDIPLPEEAGNAVLTMEDDLVALLALDADRKGRFATPLDRTSWETLVGTGDALSGQHWLLAYEATRKGWLGSAAPEVAGHPFFELLLKNDVFFYDEHVVHQPFRGPAAPLPGGFLPDSSL